LSIPSHFRSVSPTVLKAAKESPITLNSIASNSIEEGRPALATHLIPLIENEEVQAELLLAIDDLYKDFPYLLWTGGPATFYEPFVQQFKLDRERPQLMPTLLPDSHREWLLGYLEQSPNKRVQLILETGQLSNYQLFLPVYSNAGQPLEAILILVALAEQSQIFNDSFREELNQNVTLALEGDSQALKRLEGTYAGFLTLANRTRFHGFSRIVDKLQSSEDLLFLSSAVQKNEDSLNLFFAASEMVDDPQDLFRYLKSLDEKSWEGLEVAVPLGSSAVNTLIRFDRPLYTAPIAWQKLPPILRWEFETINQFAERLPNMALLLKALLLGIAGSLILTGLFSLLPARPTASGSRRIHHLLQADKIVGGIVTMILLWVLFEPSLLDFKQNEEGSLNLNLAQVLPTDNTNNPESQSSETMIDQVTILILLFFFVTQLMVFIYGLIRINEIRRQPVSASTKLKLLDNEDHLFDLGLYIGLGGTVTSLILIVLNFVDASLMAAYASTLFGIIFVAVLKIGFLRPFRRKVILSENS